MVVLIQEVLFIVKIRDFEGSKGSPSSISSTVSGVLSFFKDARRKWVYKSMRKV